jgi:hypothetical protein
MKVSVPFPFTGRGIHGSPAPRDACVARPYRTCRAPCRGGQSCSGSLRSGVDFVLLVYTLPDSPRPTGPNCCIVRQSRWHFYLRFGTFSFMCSVELRWKTRRSSTRGHGTFSDRHSKKVLVSGVTNQPGLLEIVFWKTVMVGHSPGRVSIDIYWLPPNEWLSSDLLKTESSQTLNGSSDPFFQQLEFIGETLLVIVNQ